MTKRLVVRINVYGDGTYQPFTGTCPGSTKKFKAHELAMILREYASRGWNISILAS